MKRILLWVLGIALIVSLTFGNGVCQQQPKDERQELYRQIELFADAITLIRADYVDAVEAKTLIYGALKGMLSSLDGYSQFLDPESYKEIKVETKGEFGGLGIEIGMRDGILTVISPIADTPAEKAGLKANDRIVKIDGESTRDITLDDAVKKLRGKPGTAVSITVLREAEKRLIDFNIKRAVIKLESIKISRILEGGVGYIRLVEFQEKSGQDLRTKIDGLKKTGMTGLILDLRNNPGGLLDASIEVSEIFLPKDDLIVSTKSREKDVEYRSRREPRHADFPLVVLVNEGSASASEIVAGAIQDNKRGIIVGTKTFGKGSVQTVIPLKDDSALRLTTAEYFTPKGKSIRDKGIMPDVTVAYEEAGKEKEEEGKAPDIFRELEEKKEIQADKERVELEGLLADNQIKTALDLLKGIRAYQAMKQP